MSSGLSGWGIGRPSGIQKALKGVGGEEVEVTTLNKTSSLGSERHRQANTLAS